MPTCKAQLQEPADSPNIVIFSGLPPKASIFFFTHLIASLWSNNPSFPVDGIFPFVISSSFKKPRGPSL